MEARPSAMVFFSFFRRVRERYLPLSFSSPLSSSSSSSSGFRDESTKGPRPRAEAERNETRFSLIRSTSSNPQCGTRTRTHISTYARVVRIYTYAFTRIFSRSHPRFFAPFGSTLSYSLFPPFSLHPPPTAWRSLSTSSSNSISPLDRLSRRLSCTSSVSFLRLVSSPLAVRLAPSPFVLSRSNNLSTRWVDVGSGRRFSLSHPIDRPFLHRYSPAAWRGCVRGREHGSRYNGCPPPRFAKCDHLRKPPERERAQISASKHPLQIP